MNPAPFDLQPNRDALFLDIDGTLLDIAATPEEVIVPQNLVDNLAALHGKLGGALALVSGRSLQSIDTLFFPLRLPASGVHGAQWRLETEREERYPLPPHIRRAIADAVAEYPDLVLEDKKYAMAVHYRRVPEFAGRVKKLLQRLVAGANPYLSVMQGKMVFEIVYPGHNKGSAIERFMAQAPFAGRRPVFLGDDETDVFAMKACQKLGGIATYVGPCRAFFDHAFASPGEVRSWIGRQI